MAICCISFTLSTLSHCIAASPQKVVHCNVPNCFWFPRSRSHSPSFSFFIRFFAFCMKYKKHKNTHRATKTLDFYHQYCICCRFEHERSSCYQNLNLLKLEHSELQVYYIKLENRFLFVSLVVTRWYLVENFSTNCLETSDSCLKSPGLRIMKMVKNWPTLIDFRLMTWAPSM